MDLIGEHTDYNDGFVLPVALPLHVRVQLTRRADRTVRIRSREMGDGWHELELGRGEPSGTWLDHVVGVTLQVPLDRGFDMRIASDLPMGSGLGSSGTLGVAALRAIREAFDLALDDVTVARLAQRSENEFVGARSGIMDQLAASVGREGEALFIDCRSLGHQRIPLPDDLELVVVDSGIRHEHATGAYNERRRQCEEAARLLGVPALRDAGPEDASRVEALPEPLSRRARHVVAENARVLGAVAALREGDLVGLGELLDGSHRSLRDDYEVSTPEIDLLVDLVREQEGMHGARITGGGFGGSIVAVADPGTGHHSAARAVAEYEQRTGVRARVILPLLEPDEVAPA